METYKLTFQTIPISDWEQTPFRWFVLLLLDYCRWRSPTHLAFTPQTNVMLTEIEPILNFLLHLAPIHLAIERAGNETPCTPLKPKEWMMALYYPDFTTLNSFASIWIERRQDGWAVLNHNSASMIFLVLCFCFILVWSCPILHSRLLQLHWRSRWTRPISVSDLHMIRLILYVFRFSVM